MKEQFVIQIIQSDTNKVSFVGADRNTGTVLLLSTLSGVEMFDSIGDAEEYYLTVKAEIRDSIPFGTTFTPSIQKIELITARHENEMRTSDDIAVENILNNLTDSQIEILRKQLEKIEVS